MSDTNFLLHITVVVDWLSKRNVLSRRNCAPSDVRQYAPLEVKQCCRKPYWRRDTSASASSSSDSEISEPSEVS